MYLKKGDIMELWVVWHFRRVGTSRKTGNNGTRVKRKVVGRISSTIADVTCKCGKKYMIEDVKTVAEARMYNGIFACSCCVSAREIKLPSLDEPDNIPDNTQRI